MTYEEFSVFYKMMSLRRDVFLLMMAYSDRKDHLTADELANFLRNEQKVRLHSPPGASKAPGPVGANSPGRVLFISLRVDPAPST